MKAYVDASPTRACVIFIDGTKTAYKEIVEAHSTYTNNEAEYRAVLHALYLAKLRHYSLTEIVSDSQLVVKQLNGEYKVRKAELALLAIMIWDKTGANYQIIDDAQKLTEKGNVKFTWVRREENPAGRALE